MQQFFDFPVTPSCTFSSFIVCHGNASAVEFARRIADQSNEENLLYLHGPSGSGKSRLLRSIAQSLNSCNPAAALFFSCAGKLAAEDLTSRFSGAQALLVDDLHLLPDDDAHRNGLWQIFNEYHDSGRKVAMAGLYPPRELANLDEHLVSRLLWGLVARVDASDDSSRRMILKKIADDRQVRVPDEVVDFILVTTGREVSELIRAFEVVYRHSMAEKRRITLPLAREALGAIITGISRP